LHEPFVLSSVLGTEASTREDQHEGIVSLQLRERAARATMVRQLVVGKHGAGNDVDPHRRMASMCCAPTFTDSSGVFPCSRATMYAAYQSDQWCFGAVGSYSPWCSSASRRSSVRLGMSRLLSPRPGSRVVTSWSSQVLPSGSLKVAYVP